MAQYDKLSEKYTQLITTDPLKQYSQFPSILKAIGETRDKIILDVGCGDGLLARVLNEKGAVVEAYDSSNAQIEKAMKSDLSDRINYILATPYTYVSSKKFDKVFSCVVLPYADNTEYLKQFFTSTYKYLKEDAFFVSLIINPDYGSFNKSLYGRVFKRKNQKIEVNFLNRIDNETILSDFKKTDYEKASIDAGFKSFEWKNLFIKEEGMKTMGDQYWNNFLSDCPNIIFIAYK
jgi:toxoflavin synthase